MRITRAPRCPVSYRKSGLIQAPEPLLYSVIARTQHYPAFIPFVDHARIVKQVSPLENYTQLTISYNKFKQLSYTSYVKLTPSQPGSPNSAIYSLCNEDPLKKLESLWQIEGRGGASFVQYSLDFQFVSPFYMLASSILKDYMGEQMWNIFEKQALLEHSQAKAHAKANPQPLAAQPDEQTSKQRLQRFLETNPEIKALYQSNGQAREKIEQAHRRLQGQSDYEGKMGYEMRNLRAHL